MTRIIVFFSDIFTEPALREVHRRHPTARLERMLGNRAALFQYPGTFPEFTSPWLTRLPVYLHHACPIHGTVSLGPSRVLPDTEDRRTTIRVLCPDTHETLDEEQHDSRVAYYRGAKPIDDVEATRVLTLVRGEEYYFFGRHELAHNISPWADGIPDIRERTLNRAGPKLLEALDCMPLLPRPGQRALDLGSGMGAWTHILRRRGLEIFAVDKRLPVRKLREDSGVHHHRSSAEEYIIGAPRRVDLIVNDMIMDAQDSARLMVAYASRLKSDGTALMTLKLRPRNRSRILDHSLRILRSAYQVVVLRQLYFNKNEMTALLRPRRKRRAEQEPSAPAPKRPRRTKQKRDGNGRQRRE